MKILRKPQILAAFVSVISLFYASVFILISGHLEFERILDHTTTLNSSFWNGWSAFLKQGNIKYIGYAYILFAFAIVIISLIQKQEYDEYQVSILEKGIMAMGTVMVLLCPTALILVLSDPSYCVETLLLLVVAHWSAVLIADLIYVIRHHR